MKRSLFALSLSLIFIAGSFSASAERKNDHRGDYRKSEQSKNPKKDSRNNFKKDFNNRSKDADKSRKEYNRNYNFDERDFNRKEKSFREREKMSHRNRVMYGQPGWSRPPKLDYMVRHIDRGAKDVSVWQVDYNTYVVRYRKGHKWYKRLFNPYTGHYSSPALINVNWQIPGSWIQIPPIQININI